MWRHNGKSGKTVLGYNGEMNDWWFFLAGMLCPGHKIVCKKWNYVWVTVNNDFCQSWGDSTKNFTCDFFIRGIITVSPQSWQKKSLFTVTHTLFYISQAGPFEESVKGIAVFLTFASVCILFWLLPIIIAWLWLGQYHTQITYSDVIDWHLFHDMCIQWMIINGKRYCGFASNWENEKTIEWSHDRPHLASEMMCWLM